VAASAAITSNSNVTLDDMLAAYDAIETITIARADLAVRRAPCKAAMASV
jgi:hypothetical protein